MGEIRVVLQDRHRADDAYRSGLRHGLITTQVTPPPAQDSACKLLLELPFLGLRFPLRGTVVHSGKVATVIRIEEVPDRVHEVLGGAPPKEKRSFPPSEDTVISPQVSGRTSTVASIAESASRESWNTVESAQISGDVEGEGDADDLGASTTGDDESEVWSVDGPHTVTLEDSFDEDSLDDDSLGSWSDSVSERNRPPDLSSSPSARIEPPKRVKRNYLAERLRQSTEERRVSIEEGRTSQAAREPGGTLSSEGRPSAGRVSGEWFSEAPPPLAPVTPAKGPGLPVPFKPNRFLPAVSKLEGSLEEHSAYEMFLRVYDAMLTGVGVLDLPGERYWVFFLNGKPVHYLRDPELQSESIEALLIRKKLLSQPVLDWVRWLSEVTSQPIVSIVMRLGLITEGQMHSLRTTQVKMITRRVLDQRRGTYRLFEAPDIRKVFRNPAVTVTEMLWKRATFTHANLTEAQIDAHLEKLRDKDISPTPLGESLLSQFPLSDEQRALVERHLGSQTAFSELRKRASGLERREVVELVLCLHLMGLVTLSKIRRGRDPEAARLERLLRQQYTKLDGDHFQFLDLHWSALPEEIAVACDKVEESLEDIASAAAFIRDFDRISARLRQRIEDLRAMARDKRARKKYRARLVGEAERTMASEMYLKQAEMALFRKELPQAEECFRRMLEIDPGGSGSAERRQRAHDALVVIQSGRGRPRTD